jgi:hypothetical protein
MARASPFIPPADEFRRSGEEERYSAQIGSASGTEIAEFEKGEGLFFGLVDRQHLQR